MTKTTSEGGGTTVADVLVSELAAWGITLYFGIPGSSSLPLVDAIRRNPDARYIVVRHEQTAALAASAYNKFTGKIAVCLTIAGPGATNLATGLYDAKEDRASVLSLNGQVQAQYAGPGGIQEIDQDAFFRPIAVFNNTVADPSTAVKLLTRALRYAIVARGVAQLSVPNDIQREPLEPAYCERETCLSTVTAVPTDEAVQAAADAIDGAMRPVILAGFGAMRAAGAVLELAETIRAPIVTTFRAKGILPDENEWVAGVHGPLGTPHARTLIAESDLVIACGASFSDFTGIPGEKRAVHIDIDPLQLGKHPLAAGVYGDCAVAVPMIRERVRPREDTEVRAWLAGQKQEWLNQLDREADPEAVPIRPPYIMKVLSETLPEDAVISLDVGENQWWFGRSFRMKRQRFAMSGYLGTMGFGLPGAIAAKLAYPDATVVCITGDGGFSMVMADFVTAVRNDLPIVVVVLNNHELAMIREEQREANYPPYGVELTNPDFAAYAEACGGAGIRVARPQDLADAVLRALRMDKPVVVDIETDPVRFG
ncbi:thiamine pyrophosphate-binding protein [Methanoculleus sp. FWC-SCC3]|uniref:Thiamine pyrophosphate-binding protein n=1 Tax=Methanoculleus methanifontis TaxID=2584086 RepID=A0ABT8LXV6_9EURY|nr:thiamine pyrophosphate-dependent enzyme [Methanoculleus sp. FWC-SCC3]MDN7011610.1 thiamine pyrophosphate-binding protein [Methanoculleus sp. FWC-SCC3]